MVNFRKVKLKDVCKNITYGFTASASDVDIGPKFLRITDIVPTAINWKAVPYCKIPENQKKKYLLLDGDIVVARTGATTGYAKYLKNPPEAVFASYLVNFRVNEANNSRFIGHIIQSQAYKNFIQKNLSGSAQPQANAQILGSYELFLPCKETQTRIASVLSAYDDLIENNEKRIKILEEMAQLLYTEWFVKFKFPGHEKVKMVDSGTEYGMVPEGWEVRKLGDKLNVSKGRNITRSTIIDGTIPVVAGGLSPAYYHDTSNACNPVITVSASGANAGFVNLYQEDIWASDCSYIDQKTTPFVYFYYLFFKNKQVEITKMQRGSAQPHVYPKDLMQLTILSTPDKLICEFERKAQIIFVIVKILKKQNKKLSKIKDILIPQLVTGKIGLK